MEVKDGTSNVISARGIAPQLKYFVEIQVFLTIACAICEVYSSAVLHLTGAYIYPLKTRSQTAWDFTLFAAQFKFFHRPEFFLVREFPYPAPSAIPYAIFFSYHAHPLRFFFGFILTSFFLAGLLLSLALRRRGVSTIKTAFFVFVSLLLSFPLWYELKQGNIEICVWVLVTAGVWAFCKNRGYTAAACFGIAGSMKIFPFVYVGLLLARRKYLEVACACVASIFSTFISLWLVGPNIFQTWRKIEAGIAFTRETYILQFIPEANGFDHSIFAFIKRFWHRLPGPGPLGHFVSIYLCVAAICGIALYLLKIRHLPLINQVLCLCIASILLPPMSADYTLMHLYVPWGMMVLFAQERWALGERVPGLFAAFVCLAIIFSPESEFIRHGVHLGGQIKCLVLLVLMYIGLTYPFGVSGAPLSAASKVR